MDTVLDCSDSESAVLSVANILGMPQKELCDRIMHHRSHNRWAQDRENSLLRKLQGDSARVDYVACWHHVGYCVDTKSYKQLGLRSTQQMSGILEEFLGKLAIGEEICGSETEWEKLLAAAMKNKNSRGKAIGHSPSSGHDAGPSGFLVREWVNSFCPSYLQNRPEYVTEICSQIEQCSGMRQCGDLLAAFDRSVSRVIVKFRSNEGGGNALETAVEYIYCKLHSLSVETASCGYCAGGNLISPKNILAVDKW